MKVRTRFEAASEQHGQHTVPASLQGDWFLELHGITENAHNSMFSLVCSVRVGHTLLLQTGTNSKFVVTLAWPAYLLYVRIASNQRNILNSTSSMNKSVFDLAYIHHRILPLV
jgi:hypothetical protein